MKPVCCSVNIVVFFLEYSLYNIKADEIKYKISLFINN